MSNTALTPKHTERKIGEASPTMPKQSAPTMPGGAAPTMLLSPTLSRYCAVGVYPAGKDSPTLMASHGRVIVFDTLEVAQSVLPLLGCGRIPHWSVDGETVTFSPIDPDGLNRAVILTGYDPYCLPAGVPVGSETRGREWRRHVMWSHWMTDCGGNFVRRSDGTHANVALGEQVW